MDYFLLMINAINSLPDHMQPGLDRLALSAHFVYREILI